MGVIYYLVNEEHRQLLEVGKYTPLAHLRRPATVTPYKVQELFVMYDCSKDYPSILCTWLREVAHGSARVMDDARDDLFLLEVDVDPTWVKWTLDSNPDPGWRSWRPA